MKKFKRLKTEVYDNVSANLNEVAELMEKTQSPYLTLQSVAEVDDPFENSAIDFVNLDFKMDSTKPIEDDFYNAKMLYEKLSLTPQQATDKYFWSGLAFSEAFIYLKHRWGLKDQKDYKYRILLFNNMRRGLFFNGISRLWWFYHLAHNDKLEDPEKYAKMIFSNVDIVQNLVYRNLSSSFQVRMAYFKYIYNFKKKYGNPNKNHLSKSVKALSLLGGSSVIDSLSENDIYDYLLDQKISNNS